MTYWLWQALQTSPAHPLPHYLSLLMPAFRRSRPFWKINVLWPLIRNLGLLVIVMFVIFGGWQIVLAVIFGGGLLYLILTGTLCGVVLASNIGLTMAHQRQSGRDVLLNVTPLGGIHAHWLLCYATYARDRLTYQMHTAALTIYGFISLPVYFIGLWAAVLAYGLMALHFLLIFTLLGAALYIDIMQSTVIGGVVGMLASTHFKDKTITQIMAIGAFLVMQMLAVIFNVWLLFLLADSFNRLGFLIILPVFITFLIREGVLALLWRWLNRRLENAPVMEASL
ncbi:MAG: hypothetical protein OHK0046_40670 [Anaerolineae bacterium]